MYWDLRVIYTWRKTIIQYVLGFTCYLYLAKNNYTVCTGIYVLSIPGEEWLGYDNKIGTGHTLGIGQ